MSTCVGKTDDIEKECPGVEAGSCTSGRRGSKDQVEGLD